MNRHKWALIIGAAFVVLVTIFAFNQESRGDIWLKSVDQEITFSQSVLDSLGREYALPDSIWIKIRAMDGSDISDTRLTTGDGRVSADNDDSALVFVDQWQDIDGDGNDSTYEVTISTSVTHNSVYLQNRRTTHVHVRPIRANIKEVGDDAITDNGDALLEVNVEEWGDDAAISSTSGQPYVMTVSTAPDAINYAAFAEVAPTAWWNEGKTGYSLAATGSDADTGIAAMKTKLTAIDTKTTNLPADPADDGDIDAQLATAQTDLDNPNQYKADVSDLALQAQADSIHVGVNNLMYFFGACDSCYYRLFPEGGAANKDSILVIDPNRAGPDSLVGRVIYFHGTTANVYDSASFHRDFPW